jgi:hypothetical protein
MTTNNIAKPIKPLMNNSTTGSTPNTIAKLPVVHVPNSLDGGAGKSMQSRILCAYYEDKGRDYQLIDTDPKLDVAIAYAPELFAKWRDQHTTGMNFMKSSAITSTEVLREQLLISRNRELYNLGDRLIEAISPEEKNGIVQPKCDSILSMPSNNHDDFKFWIDQNRITIESAEDFTMVSWWMSNGLIDNQKAFIAFVEEYPYLNHVIVANTGIKCASSSWMRFTWDTQIIKLIEDGVVKETRMEPFLSDGEILQRVASGETFSKIKPTLHKSIGNKLTGWLMSNWNNFEATGLL